MPILNYTTHKDASTSISEIQKILVKHGCRKISVDYDVNGLASNLTFTGIFNNQAVFYSLPCNFDKVHKVLLKQTKDRRYNTKEQAIRTGWRILKDWIEAQMAIVETEMVDISEVFLPYMVTRGGERLYDYIKALPENSSPIQLQI